MTPERWRLIETIFQHAADLEPSARTLYLDKACRNDPELRQEVEALLASDTPLGPLIRGAVLEAAAELDPEGSDLSAIGTLGRRIGPYRLARLLGRGGMGSVYLAVRDDEQYEKTVAIKLVRRGMASDFVLRRFRRECQILARLEHPNIARLLDAGVSSDGLPYLVMEYVDGKPINQYCEAAQLSIRERLELFRQVCSAVHHAHQNLVVHRDLKPSNVLVTAEGVPKLLDFGIAKLLDPAWSDDSVSFQAAGFRVLTPDYASPEQVRGEPPTTATDIYSLGAMLYELLTGQRPHRLKSKSPAEAVQVICQADTEKPSTAIKRREDLPLRTRRQRARQLAGELDNIILMAMHKNAAHRYVSADQLSEDIRRYLEGRPVLARQDSVFYRTTKFVRRHGVPLLATSLLLVTLVSGIIATTVQARRAERRFQQVRELANTLLSDYEEKLRGLPAATELRASLVTTVLGYLDALAEDARDDRNLGMDLAAAYERAADVLGNPLSHNLGQPQEALKNLQKAIAIYERVAGPEPADPALIRRLAWAYFKAGDLEAYCGNSSSSADSYRKGFSLAASLSTASSSPVENYEIQLVSYLKAGDVLLRAGHAPAAIPRYEHGLAIASKWSEIASVESAKVWLCKARHRLADALRDSGALEQALDQARQGHAIAEGLLRDNPSGAEPRRLLAAMKISVARLLGDPTGLNLLKPREAIQYAAEAYSLTEQAASADPADVLALHDLVSAARVLGVLLAAKDPERAAALHRRGITALARHASLRVQSIEFAYHESVLNACLGMVLKEQSRLREAVSHLRSALALQEEISRKDPSRLLFRRSAGKTHLLLADVLLDEGSTSEAALHYRNALKIAEGLVQLAPKNAEYLADQADALEGMARYHLWQARSGATASERAAQRNNARLHYQKNLNIWSQWDRSFPSTVYSRRRQAEVLSRLARLDAHDRP